MVGLWENHVRVTEKGDKVPGSTLRVAELFAGVGGFRLGLERSGWQVVWSDQWEPSTKTQHASSCYETRFGSVGHVCEDIARVLDAAEAGEWEIPDHELLVGGFPCQDYSVAKSLNKAHGIAGKKGVLWWEIHRALSLKKPPLLFLENVDRLLKSPASQRGRDFAIMLASLSDLGYSVEWRVINAADYGFPQRRRRVLLVGYDLEQVSLPLMSPLAWLLEGGVLARSFPVERSALPAVGDSTPPDVVIEGDLAEVSQQFGQEKAKRSPFASAGIMRGRRVWTRDVQAKYEGHIVTLGEVLLPEDEVPESYFVSEDQLESWRYLKGAKSEPRVHSGSGTTYVYSEGPLPFPDPLDRPARTVLTGEGGSGPSRFKHIVATPSGRFRRLTPTELERLNGFPDGWTEGMSDVRRAFCMGNALVVGLIERVGRILKDTIDGLGQDTTTVVKRPTD
jgi:DNA (cytosine-5)-methyltransferase 1